MKNIKEISMYLIIVVLMFSEGGYAGKRNGFLIDVDSRLIKIIPGNSFDFNANVLLYQPSSRKTHEFSVGFQNIRLN